MALSSRKRDQLFWVLGAVASAVLLAQTWTRAHRPGGIDLTTYLAAAAAVERGESPYALSLAFPYIYPPFFAFALIPLVHLPADLVLVLWFVASIAAILWAMRSALLAGQADLRGRALTPLFAALIAALYPIFQSNLRNSQVNFFVVALAVAALTMRSVAGRGVAWALGIAIKILPAALAPFFVRRLDWRVCAGALAALVVLCLAPALTMGASIEALTREYLGLFLRGSYAGPSSSAPLDFSLGGILAGVVGADGPFVRQLGTVVPILAILVIDLLARPSAGSDAHMFALYLAVIPMASPKSEVHHLAFALPAAVLVFGAAWFAIDRRPVFLALLGFAVVSYASALIFTGSSGPFWFGFVLLLVCATAARVKAR